MLGGALTSIVSLPTSNRHRLPAALAALAALAAERRAESLEREIEKLRGDRGSPRAAGGLIRF